jgi:cysteine desulfurase
MLFGGGQQNAIRPGTQPTALIAAFAAALKTPNPALPTLKARLITGLQALCMKINTMNDCEYVDNIVNFSCGVKSEVMLHFLAEHNIAVSSGSACARGKKSRILPAYGITEKDIDTAIRVSFGQQNTVKEVEIFLEVLEKGVYRFTS